MNPFNFYGPQFLLFYAILAIVMMIAITWLRRKGELLETAYSDAPWNDPYRIAYLRGGKNELVRVAVVSLVDRGLITVSRDRLQTSAVGSRTQPRKRIERDLIQFCVAPRDPKDLFDRFDQAASEYEAELKRMRLLPDAQMTARRRVLFLGAAAVLLFFSVGKIIVAITRARPFAFLVILTAIALALLAKVAFPRLSARGKALLENVHNLFLSLKVRAPQIRPGGASTEAVMLAAVFGVGALPREHFIWAQQMFPRPQTSSDSSSSSSCGSSCGSSSCGGGGCGGGCGGCGS